MSPRYPNSRCGDAEAAAIAGYGIDSSQRVWEQLVAEGMPAPHYNLKRDGKPSRRRSWDRLALQLWADSRRDPRFRQAEHGDALAGERARLARRLDRIEERGAS
jgi:hypothetical protein